MFNCYFVLKLITSLEQITKEVLIEFLKVNNIELKSTHDRLCIPIINRLYKKMAAGLKFTCIKVADDIIIDGHHRYLASLFANVKLDRAPSIKTSAKNVTAWHSVVLVDEDWDTEAKIRMFDELDAKYNVNINE
jgi:hypothetical protein